MIAIILSTVVLLLFALFRNVWVLNRSMKVLYGEDGLKEHSKLASYNTMMLKFWVWDINKFKKGVK